jgi:galactose oxidase
VSIWNQATTICHEGRWYQLTFFLFVRRITEELVSSTNHDMFCPGTTLLPNGVVMISGGSNSKATTFYDFRNNLWSIGPEMNIRRGYQAHTLLANGEVFSLGGSWSGDGSKNKDGELWSPSTNSWRLLTGAPSAPLQTNDAAGRYRADNHYWLFVAPNGKVCRKNHTESWFL